MSKRSLLLLLVVWNFLLTGAVVWSLSRPRVPEKVLKEKLDGLQASDGTPAAHVIDTAAIPEARIAYFMMDSIQLNYELVKESAARVRSEGQRMEGNLQREMQRAQARYAELMAKDHTYSTQAELKADQAEVEQLGEKIQRLQAESQDQLDALQVKMLSEIAEEIKGFLKEYNQTAGFDYIFSIQDGGQVWVGNEGLDITGAVLQGLNARHRARQAAKGK
ncbi:MAG TPA: OmpH family outer membrane protein [Flavobacteriales bacterium]|nr:OmpH family outer membrane protein [Flavobacteriales bacterium]